MSLYWSGQWGAEQRRLTFERHLLETAAQNIVGPIRSVETIPDGDLIAIVTKANVAGDKPGTEQKQNKEVSRETLRRKP